MWICDAGGDGFRGSGSTHVLEEVPRFSVMLISVTILAMKLDELALDHFVYHEVDRGFRDTEVRRGETFVETSNTVLAIHSLDAMHGCHRWAFPGILNIIISGEIDPNHPRSMKRRHTRCIEKRSQTAWDDFPPSLNHFQEHLSNSNIPATLICIDHKRGSIYSD